MRASFRAKYLGWTELGSDKHSIYKDMAITSFRSSVGTKRVLQSMKSYMILAHIQLVIVRCLCTLQAQMTTYIKEIYLIIATSLFFILLRDHFICRKRSLKQATFNEYIKSLRFLSLLCVLIVQLLSILLGLGIHRVN